MSIGSPVMSDRATRCDKMYHFADANATRRRLLGGFPQGRAGCRTCCDIGGPQ